MLVTPLRLASAVLAVGALAGTQPGLATALTLTLAALIAATLVVHRCAAVPAVAIVRSGALRQRARRTSFLRQRDPDASGRPRPRAPSQA